MDEASAAHLSAIAGGLGDSSWLVLGARRGVSTARGFVAAPGSERSGSKLLGPLSREDSLALAEATPNRRIGCRRT